METKIKQALKRLFEKHRIIFWYDSKHELREDYEGLELEDVEKIELKNNEFGIKHYILREKVDTKFILYHEGPQPADMENWLLDVQLGHGEFRTDQVAIWLSELELGIEFADIVQDHSEFYRAAKRKESLKQLLQSDDTPGKIRLKMLSVCAGSDHRIDSVMEKLLEELSNDADEKIKLIIRCDLDKYLWEQLDHIYSYHSDSPTVMDFCIELFKSCYAMGTDGNVKLSGDALIFLKRWKDSLTYKNAFETLSDRCADLLSIEQDLYKRDIKELLELDYFSLIDKKIISDLVGTVSDRTISADNCALMIRQRQQTHWYQGYKDIYEAVNFASKFISTIDKVNIEMPSITEGINMYVESWFKLDQLYRKFIYYMRSSRETSLLEPLYLIVENLYSNNFLLKVNDNWQHYIDSIDKWTIPSIHGQNKFYDKYVDPFLKNKKKVFVIISDALRYEIGEEFLNLMQKEDRFEASLEPILSSLPSYTQLGMAALLPNKELKIADGEKSTVFVDGLSSQGTINRSKILGLISSHRIKAVKADEIMALNGDECKAIIREHDSLYIYHNRIDAMGDKRETEERVFEAVEDALKDIKDLVKKLAGANANNLIVTADHGFIYQNKAIDESDFSTAEVSGSKILYNDRRFIIGKGLVDNNKLKKFSSGDLGLVGEVEVQIPKSINRLRIKGSGSRFVHGGASLQEVIIPVIKINKKRKSDVSTVEVDIIHKTSNTITSGQLAVILYQVQAVDNKVKSRNLKAGIYTLEGNLISDSHDLSFDVQSDNPREREQKVQFLFTKKADDANNQEVILKLEEPVKGTSHFKEYKTVRYLLRRSFTSDFGF